jgi:hypothetical protein
MQSCLNTINSARIFLTACCYTALPSHSQPTDSVYTVISDSISFYHIADTLSAYDDNHYKHGYWLVYLNNKLIPVEDLNDAYYYAFEYFEHGGGARVYNWAYKSKKAASKVRAGSDRPVKGRPVLLHGTFNFYDRRGDISLNHTYRNGIPIRMESYTYKRGIRYSKEILDFNQKLLDQTMSCHYEMYGPGCELMDSFYLGKGPDGVWGVVRTR